MRLLPLQHFIAQPSCVLSYIVEIYSSSIVAKLILRNSEVLNAFVRTTHHK